MYFTVKKWVVVGLRNCQKLKSLEKWHGVVQKPVFGERLISALEMATSLHLFDSPMIRWSHLAELLKNMDTL
jgi:hypothetical protein